MDEGPETTRDVPAVETAPALEGGRYANCVGSTCFGLGLARGPIILLDYCSGLPFASEFPAFARLISLPTMGPCGLGTIGRVEALEQKETFIWLTSIFPKASPGFVDRC